MFLLEGDAQREEEDMTRAAAVGATWTRQSLLHTGVCSGGLWPIPSVLFVMWHADFPHELVVVPVRRTSVALTGMSTTSLSVLCHYLPQHHTI
jgi:hypothetical protein